MCIVKLVSPGRMGRRCGTQWVGSRRELPMQSRKSGKWSSGRAGTKNSVSGAGRFQSSTKTEFVNTACGRRPTCTLDGARSLIDCRRNSYRCICSMNAVESAMITVYFFHHHPAHQHLPENKLPRCRTYTVGQSGAWQRCSPARMPPRPPLFCPLPTTQLMHLSVIHEDCGHLAVAGDSALTWIALTRRTCSAEQHTAAAATVDPCAIR